MEPGRPCVLRELIREVADFPQPGVSFKDLTPLLGDPDCFRYAVDAIADHFSGHDIEAVAGIDARGFLFAAPVAYRLGVSFVPLRKPGKLPRATIGRDLDLEYGSDGLQIHVDAFSAPSPTLIIDDVLATGGTAAAATELVTEAGGVVCGYGFVAELEFLAGRNKLGDGHVHSLVSYS